MLRLRAFGARRFAGGHLAAAQAVGDALVLIGLAGVGVVVAAGGAVGRRNGLRLRVLLRDLVIGVELEAAVVAGTSVVHRGELRAVLRGEVLMLHLV